MAKPRGLLNNNPGNIWKTPTKWLGEIDSSDPNFEQFSDIRYGYRALIKLLKGSAYLSAPSSYTYYRVWEGAKGKAVNGPLNTIDKIFSKYCDDATTADYVKAVEKFMGISRFAEIDSNDDATVKRLVMAISYQENGVKAVEADVEAAFQLLADEKKSPLNTAVLVEDLTSDGGAGGFAVVGAILVFLFFIFKD